MCLGKAQLTDTLHTKKNCCFTSTHQLTVALTVIIVFTTLVQEGLQWRGSLKDLPYSAAPS